MHHPSHCAPTKRCFLVSASCRGAILGTLLTSWTNFLKPIAIAEDEIGKRCGNLDYSAVGILLGGGKSAFRCASVPARARINTSDVRGGFSWTEEFV
jgi:hypothetical protein